MIEGALARTPPSFEMRGGNGGWLAGVRARKRVQARWLAGGFARWLTGGFVRWLTSRWAGWLTGLAGLPAGWLAGCALASCGHPLSADLCQAEPHLQLN